MATYKKIAAVIFLGILFCAPVITRAQEDSKGSPKGTLFIIGGGDRSDAMMSRFVDLAGGKNASIIIIPMASDTPLEFAKFSADQFRRLGAARVEWLLFPKGQADSPANLEKMKGAGGVFFCGGDQVRLTSFMAGTRLLEEVRRIYREGGVVGGTSAGAAVMSKVMITGDDRLEENGESFTSIRANSVITAEGFGFLPPDIVVDQHFLVRKRENRLISLVLERPALTGIGIDEATVLLVGPGGTTGEVLGDSLVSVYDASGAGPVSTDAKGHLAVRGLTLHLLKAGEKLDLRRTRPAEGAAK